MLPNGKEEEIAGLMRYFRDGAQSNRLDHDTTVKIALHILDQLPLEVRIRILWLMSGDKESLRPMLDTGSRYRDILYQRELKWWDVDINTN